MDDTTATNIAHKAREIACRFSIVCPRHNAVAREGGISGQHAKYCDRLAYAIAAVLIGALEQRRFDGSQYASVSNDIKELLKSELDTNRLGGEIERARDRVEV